MRSLPRFLLFACLCPAVLSGVNMMPAHAAGEPLTDAREQVPIALIGPWKADLAASTYPGAKPKAATRTFAYTADGKVLVTFMTVNAQGKFSMGHWATQVDGTPAIEYHSAGRSIPYNVVSFRKVDENRFDLSVMRHGKLDLTAVYKLSDDGRTLTYSYADTIVIYRRWDMLD